MKAKKRKIWLILLFFCTTLYAQNEDITRDEMVQTAYEYLDFAWTPNDQCINQKETAEKPTDSNNPRRINFYKPLIGFEQFGMAYGWNCWNTFDEFESRINNGVAINLNEGTLYADQFGYYNYYEFCIGTNGIDGMGWQFGHAVTNNSFNTYYTDTGETRWNKNEIIDPKDVYYKIRAWDTEDLSSDFTDPAYFKCDQGIIDNPSFKIANIIPEKYLLFQNYPNPFNPETTLKFGIPEQSRVKLKVYNLAGKEIITLTNDILSAGIYTINFSAKKLSSGVYFYQLSAKSTESNKDFSEVKRMLVIK